MRAVNATVSAVRLGRLGDLVMTLPALGWLATHVHLQVVTDARYVPLMSHALPGATVLADPREAAPADVVLDLHGVAASRRTLAGLPRVPGARTVRVRKESVRRRALLLPALGIRGGKTWPERHLGAAARVLAALGVEAAAPRAIPRLSAGRGAGDPSRGDSSGRDSSGGPVLGLVPGAAHPTKRWPVEHFAALATAWHERTGGRSLIFAPDAEEALVHEVVVPHARWARDGERPLLDLCAGLAGCDVVVAADTGPLHVAGALGVPVVGLFGPTPRDAGFWVWGARGTALSVGAGCAPCSMHGARACSQARRVCLEDLAPADVLDAALALRLRRAG